MLVVIDIGPSGEVHFIETNPDIYPKVEHPDGSGLTGVDVMLKHHDKDPAARERGGWHIMNQLPGEDAPRSRWDRLVAACNHPDADPQAKALGLGQTPLEDV